MSCTAFPRQVRSGSARAMAAGLLCTIVASSVSRGAGKEDIDSTAARLVREAGQAAIKGDTAHHFALLRQAVRLDRDYQLARWQLGQVQMDGQWLTVEEAQRRAAANPKQAVYRRLRKDHGESPAGQLALARWCRSNNLEEESRFHWASVLSIDPNNKEALRKLGMHWYDGRLLARDQINQAKQEAIGARRASRRWSAEVADWERALAKKSDGTRGEILDEIRAVSDPEAIPAFERVTLEAEDSRAARNEPRRQLSQAFVDALGAMSDHAATESLVRHAVRSAFSEVRYGAIDRLRERPLHDFVPLLLDGLAARIDSSFRMVIDDDGSVHYLHSMYREGPFADWSHRATRSIRQQPEPARMAARSADDVNLLGAQPAAETRIAAVSAAGARRSATRYEQQAMLAEQQVAQANEAAAALNERITAVLMGTTDQDLGTEPRAWWDWWQDYTDYYRTPDRPVYETQDVSSEYIIPTAVQCECFARGTLVWTKTGQRPIDMLELGDLVLSQNVDTGELAYKPVIGRTVRPPSEILSVGFQGEQIRTTRGHPFWVAGAGWRMAKELEGGAVLHGVTGSTRVSAVQPAGQEEAFNLVVADFNTYFVGESGVLVHDNTPRRPTRACVPGLMVK